MNNQLKIVVDQNMPGIEQLFGSIADIDRADGRSISADMLKDADALLCRSITQVNSKLLHNSKVKFVGTATIGTDHLDINWLESNNIQWSNAAGCNAAAVAQYVLSGIAYWCKQTHRKFRDLKIGIIGAGNVGTELSKCFDLLDIRYCLNDPPLKSKGDKRLLVGFDQILKCDVLTLHVPLVEHGCYATKHLFDRQTLSHLNGNQLLVNASRGAVVDNHALTNRNLNSIRAQVILDVFEKEPDVPPSLLRECLLATPHIAGHTLEGKLRGSWMIYRAFCQAFGLVERQSEAMLYPANNRISLQNDLLEDQLLTLYDIQVDSEALGAKGDYSIAVHFDRLRRDATQLQDGTLRRDYSGWDYLGRNNLPL